MDAVLRTMRASVVALGLMAFSGFAFAATDSGNERKTYTWSAELIEFDASSATAIVRARLVTRDGAEVLKDAAEGDRLTLTWSGISRAAGIRHFTIGEPTETDSMSMPVEFVALSDDGIYVDFRVPVPADNLERIGQLEPGRWITATAMRPAATWHEGVTHMKAFTDVDVS